MLATSVQINHDRKEAAAVGCALIEWDHAALRLVLSVGEKKRC